jgi:UDP-N-acetyl-D-mannosaminuronic acid dehydrogenase
MDIQLSSSVKYHWEVKKIGVIGPGIVGMPMAALLADARIKIGTETPARVVVVQRNSKNSGWKTAAINQGKSVIGGIEPDLDSITHHAVKAGLLSASWDFNELSDADVILVSIQTDKEGFGPDYGPLFGGLTSLALALKNKPENKIPLIIFESTLAPSSMATVIKEHFEKYGLIEGKDILLGNSPNRVMPGRLVERVTQSDKLVAGLHPETPRMIREIYKHIVTKGTLHITNSMTAEVTKTLENAYRDVRIAFSSEIVRYCDDHDIDFYALRDRVNKKLAQEDSASSDPNAVPSGGILVPMIGVGGHCLPKDGILLWWRKYLSGDTGPDSLILYSRIINDYSPLASIAHFERIFEKIGGKKLAILGAAYRFNSEDTRNSPSLQFALRCLEKNAGITIHDPYVKADDQNLEKLKLAGYFTNDLDKALADAEYIVICTAHKPYLDQIDSIIRKTPKLKGIYDGCNALDAGKLSSRGIRYAGIGKGKSVPTKELAEFAYESFRLMERGVGNEVNDLCDFLNENFAPDPFNVVRFSEVQRLGASCSTGCIIADTGKIDHVPDFKGFKSELVLRAHHFQHQKTSKTAVHGT